MQRQKKKQAEEFLQILVWANDEVKKAIEKRQYESALEILEQCQDAAIGLGTLIEEAEGEGFVTVGHIEAFCEQIYQIHESIIKDGKADAIVTHKTIAKGLGKIEKSIQCDITVCRTVVFLPYKASMWDALESIWMAAEADPNCKAYVIPIPYYEKNADGSLGTMHYEGGDYPSYVPITDYETFDFAADRPDMIFIHNPSDERNAITSIHPFFYSSKLKDLTDMLVYIPYFVLGDINPDSERARENLKPFCLLPGVIHSDYVFVQSENMRQAYIRILTEWAGKETRDVWKRKIQGLGSPKYDRVNSYISRDTDIPDSWKSVIYKENGERKKVIFYNTGLHDMLEQTGKMIDKIERTLHIFYEYRENAVLLWRPHPLIKGALSSSAPKMSERLNKIIDDYVNAAWGIYDDSADLDRAIAVSDAYYGDRSSVVQLYRQTEKPIMIQNVSI